MRPFEGLRRGGDFARLRRRGRRTATPHLTIYRSEALPDDRRTLVGISVSKDVGGAVVRNRVRRRIAASATELLAGAARSRLLIVARPDAAAAPYATLRAELAEALR